MKKRTDIQYLSQQHKNTWDTLTMLEDGLRIVGPELQKRAGVKDSRALFHIIRDLRRNGYPVGGDKTDNGGYYEARTERDMERILQTLRAPADDVLLTSDLMEAYWEIDRGRATPKDIYDRFTIEISETFDESEEGGQDDE